MGTIKCGFWTSRFLITDNEFAKFINFCVSKDFRFRAHDYESAIQPRQTLIKCYRKTYSNVISKTNYAESIRGGYVCFSLVADWFNGGLIIRRGTYGNYPFLEMAAPKAYGVDDDDGRYFHYEDIHQIEPKAREVFMELSSEIKKITRPLYENGRPVYSIRVSENAWKDLKDSCWYKKYGESVNVNAKW